MNGYEAAHGTADLCRMRLQREVPGVEQNDFGIRQIPAKGQRTSRQEMRIVLAPNRQQRWTVRLEIVLEGRVEREVTGIVQDQVELGCPRA